MEHLVQRQRAVVMAAFYTSEADSAKLIAERIYYHEASICWLRC